MGIPAGYSKAPIVFLQAGEPLVANLYVHMPLNDRLVHYRKKGDTLSLEDLVELMKLSPSQVLIPDEDFRGGVVALSGGLADGLRDGSGSPSPRSVAAASAILQGAAAVKAASAEEQKAATRRFLDESATLISEVLKQINQGDARKGFQGFLERLSSDGSLLDIHHKHVAALSALVLISLGEGDANDVSDIAFAGLVHDLGLMDLPEHFLVRHLTGDELGPIGSVLIGTQNEMQAVYARHMDLSLRKVEEGGAPISEGARKIVSQHHENFDGSGPLKIKGSKIYRPVRVFRIVDDLVSLLNSNTRQYDLETAFQVLRGASVAVGYRRCHDPEVLSRIQTKFFGSSKV